LTSAPGGFDSNRTSVRMGTVPVVSVDGDEPKKFKLGIDAEHAATVKPHAITAITRLISDPTSSAAYAAYPTRTIQESEFLAPAGPSANSLAGQSLTSLNPCRIRFDNG
jgi:hypothetical protein